VTSFLRRGSAVVRARGTVLLGLALIVAATAQTSSPQGSPPAPVCARPNVQASIVHPADPYLPPLAAQQKIFGTVSVVVSLDQQSRVVGTRIQSSPSPLLNGPALAAARATTFQTEIRGCKPIAADYIYSVDFTPEDSGTTVNGKPAIVVSATATVSRLPDDAVVTLTIRGAPASDASRAEPPTGAIAALRARLAAAGIAPADIVDHQMTTLLSTAAPTYGLVPLPATPPPVPPPTSGPPGSSAGPVVAPAARPTPPQFAAYASVRIAVSSLRALPAVFDAIRSTPGSAGGTVRYELRDGDGAYREALAQAVRDARSRAEVAATAAGVRLGAVQRIAVDTNEPVGASGSTVSLSIAMTEGVPPPAVSVRARVTGTYLIVR
jgi:uncharacterized protein YggE